MGDISRQADHSARIAEDDFKKMFKGAVMEHKLYVIIDENNNPRYGYEQVGEARRLDAFVELLVENGYNRTSTWRNTYGPLDFTNEGEIQKDGTYKRPMSPIESKLVGDLLDQ